MADLIEEWLIDIFIEIDTDKENVEEDSILAEPYEKYPWMYLNVEDFFNSSHGRIKLKRNELLNQESIS